MQVAEAETSRRDTPLSKNPAEEHCQNHQSELQPEQVTAETMSYQRHYEDVTAEAPSKCYHEALSSQ